MMTQSLALTQVLVESDVRRKISQLPGAVERLLKGGRLEVPRIPGRDVQIVGVRDLPPKKGLSTREGQGRLLHDLASIELQAMELAVRSLTEYPEAPAEFRERLASVALDEGRHLELCLNAMEEIEQPWGTWQTHVGLWACVDESDSLLDRVLIVHRYLEGSGLDASGTLVRRLEGVKATAALQAVDVIRREEVGHVQFGSEWYRKLVCDEGRDPDEDFVERMTRLIDRVPRRLEPIERDMRRSAGFSEAEIDHLEEIRRRWIQPTTDKNYARGVLLS
jgi:uncharacterized ferritin-like protein (DUF455 family)